MTRILSGLLLAAIAAAALVGMYAHSLFDKVVAQKATIVQLEATNRTLIATRQRDSRAASVRKAAQTRADTAGAEQAHRAEQAFVAERAWADAPVPESVKEALNATPTATGGAVSDSVRNQRTED
jgi:hypothetical protein